MSLTVYADEIVLIAHTLNGMQQMLDICSNFVIKYDVKYNKSNMLLCALVLAVTNAVCMSLKLHGKCIQFVDLVKYFGVCIIACHYCFRCLLEDAKVFFVFLIVLMQRVSNRFRD